MTTNLTIKLPATLTPNQTFTARLTLDGQGGRGSTVFVTLDGIEVPFKLNERRKMASHEVNLFEGEERALVIADFGGKSGAKLRLRVVFRTGDERSSDPVPLT